LRLLRQQLGPGPGRLGFGLGEPCWWVGVGKGGGGQGPGPDLVWSIAHGTWSWSIIIYRPFYFTPIVYCIELLSYYLLPIAAALYLLTTCMVTLKIYP
jgi:hypothetical protein